MSTDSSSNASTTSPPLDETYPEQLHAGKVGYGPNYVAGASLADKVTGWTEEIHGKISHKPELVKEGRDKRTGEAKRQELLGSDEDDPFGDPFSTDQDSKRSSTESKRPSNASSVSGSGSQGNPKSTMPITTPRTASTGSTGASGDNEGNTNQGVTFAD